MTKDKRRLFASRTLLLLLFTFSLLILFMRMVPAFPCDFDEDCSSGYYCLNPPNGICLPIPLSSNGESCSVDADCSSGDCNLDIDGVGKYCTVSSKECGGSGSSGYDTGYRSGIYICTGESSQATCTTATKCDTYAGYYCSGTSWNSGNGQTYICDYTDHCSGSTYYTQKYCDGNYGSSGSCSVSSGVISPDSNSAACACGGDTWMPSLGSLFGYYPSCCGDDGTSDDYTTYTGSESTSSTLTCKRCIDGNDYTWNLFGNGYFTGGSLSTALSVTCFYGNIRCNVPLGSENDGSSTTLYGNGHHTGSLTTSTSLTCYYGDMVCGDNTYSNGASQTLYGNGYLSGSGTSRTCYYGDISCTNGGRSSGSSNTIYGWGSYSGSLSTSTTVNCRSGAGTCNDGSAGVSDSISYLRGNGYVSGSTCYYGNQACSSGSESHGSSCTLGSQDICGDNVACYDCTTTGYNRASTTACKTSCTSSSDCASGYFCEANSCVDTNAKKFLIQTAGGNACMRVEDDGDVIFAGSTSYNQGNLAAPSNSFQLKDASGNVVFYVDSSCNMKAKGSLSTGQTGLSFVDDNSFYIKNTAGTYVFKINPSGNIYARGQEK